MDGSKVLGAKNITPRNKFHEDAAKMAERADRVVVLLKSHGEALKASILHAKQIEQEQAAYRKQQEEMLFEVNDLLIDLTGEHIVPPEELIERQNIKTRDQEQVEQEAKEAMPGPAPEAARPMVAAE